MGADFPRPALMTPRSPLAMGSYGGRVERWAARRIGIEMDAWQSYAVRRLLEYGSDGCLLAQQGLISVGRQNGKSVIVRSVMGWMLDEGWRLEPFRLYKHMTLAAHDANQARIPYDLIRRDVLGYEHIQGYGQSVRAGRGKVKRATMYGGIELNGIVIQTASNRADSGRGHTNGLIAFDEVLTQRDFEMHSVLVPSLVAVPNSLLLMTSTAGFADSVVLRSYYNQLYRQATGAERPDPTFVAMWWMADDDDVGLDREQLTKANPSMASGRLSWNSISLEHAILPKGNWIRERLNRWADERVDAPFSIAAWGRCRVKEPLHPEAVEEPAAYVIGVDVTASLTEASVVVAAMRKDGRVGVEVHRHLLGRQDVPLTANDVLVEVHKVAARVKVDAIVYPASSALAPAFERNAVESGLPYQALQGPRQAQACADFAEAVTSGRLAHDDPYLDSQIAVAQRRFIGQEGAWRWAISGSPSTGTVAATLASMVAARGAKPVQIFI